MSAHLASKNPRISIWEGISSCFSQLYPCSLIYYLRNGHLVSLLSPLMLWSRVYQSGLSSSYPSQCFVAFSEGILAAFRFLYPSPAFFNALRAKASSATPQIRIFRAIFFIKTIHQVKYNISAYPNQLQSPASQTAFPVSNPHTGIRHYIFLRNYA